MRKEDAYILAITGGVLGVAALLTTRRPSANTRRDQVTASWAALEYGYWEQFTPPPRIYRNAKRIAQAIYEPLYQALPGQMIINSWYRSPRVNTSVGGSKNSDHLEANAIDIRYHVNGQMRNDILSQEVIRLGLPFKQMILENGTYNRPEWVHLSYVPGENYKQILRKTGDDYTPLTEWNVLLLS